MFGGILAGGLGLADTLGFGLDDIGGLFSGIFGGGSHCTASDGESKRKIAQAVEQYTTRSERVAFIRSTGSSTSRIKPTGQGMAFFFNGEGDCYHKPGAVSPKHQRFIDQFEGWLTGKIREKKRQAQQEAIAQQQQANNSGGGGGTTTEAGGGMMKYIFFGAVALVLGYLVTQ